MSGQENDDFSESGQNEDLMFDSNAFIVFASFFVTLNVIYRLKRVIEKGIEYFREKELLSKE